MPLKIIRNDITKVSADAIVNTANPQPIYAAGTDLAIYKAAGAEKVLAERKQIGEIGRGQVAVTGAYNLSAKYIIHTVGPSWKGGKHHEYDILHDCYRNSLHKAAELKCESIAFPMIATGIYGFPKDKALQIAISEITEFLSLEEMLIYLVVFDDKSFQLSDQVMGNVQSFIDANYVRKRNQSEYGLRSRSRRLSIEEIPDTEPEVRYLECEEPESEPILASAPLDDQLANLGETFQEKLFELIESRHMSNTEVYSNANLDRKHFSKIQCNVNYHPSKKTAMALCISLKLDLEESKDLLSRADWAFSPNRKMDLIVMNAIINKEYNINKVNTILFNYGQECLGV
jgi:O-acetyl-ADP-ribose deacetylase (regulator of RNase III)